MNKASSPRANTAAAAIQFARSSARGAGIEFMFSRRPYLPKAAQVAQLAHTLEFLRFSGPKKWATFLHIVKNRPRRPRKRRAWVGWAANGT